MIKPLHVVAWVLLAVPGAGAAQTTREWITESTVTFGRGGAFRSNDSFLAGAVGVADLGVRWIRPDRATVGLSVVAGRDFPNEASLAGLRGRVGIPVGTASLEGSAAVMASSAGTGGIGHGRGLGLTFGVGYYPIRSLAVVVQLDVLPTYPADSGFASDPETTRRPAASVGLRLARQAGLVPWVGSGVAALLWLATKD